jgi:predicted anti-sigma-YlaC factor YlaD
MAVSARIDGELSEADAVRLDEHLLACLDCSAFARELVAISGCVHAADLEQLSERIVLPRPRTRRLTVRVAALAVALVALVAGSSFALGRSLGDRHPAAAAASPVAVSDLRSDSMRHHLLAILNRLAPAPVHRAGRVVAL